MDPELIVILIKTIVIIVSINAMVSLTLLLGLIFCFCMLNRQGKLLSRRVKNNLTMIQGLELSCDRLMQEFLQLGEARVKIKLFADKLNIHELQDM